MYNFVRVRASKKGKPARAGTGRSTQTPAVPVSDTTAAARPESDNEVWQRIEALKQRTTPGFEVEKKVFQFDENEPLQLISDPQKKK